MSTVEVLIAARKLIEKPEAWFTGTGTGQQRCAWSAIKDAALDDDNAYATCKVLRRAIGVPNIVVWNDAPERTHAEVLAAFSRAIELAGAE